MRPVQLRVPFFDTEGIQFHIARLSSGYSGGPHGIWISNDLVKENPTLREVECDGVIFRFVAIDPLLGVAEDAPIRALKTITYQSPVGSLSKGDFVRVDVYAEWTRDIEHTKSLLEGAIDATEDSPELKNIAHELLSNGYKYSCEFANIMRRTFKQYWFTTPNQEVEWIYVAYYSPNREETYVIRSADNFLPAGWEADHKYAPRKKPFGDILLKMIAPNDIVAINRAHPTESQTFAEEMISTALVELSEDRRRSAIIHSIIALESSAKKGLHKLISERIGGLEQASILEATSKEISIATLARVVYSQLVANTGSDSIDWSKLEKLYDVRNTIVHRGQRRLPDFDIIKDQILEIFKYVQDSEDAMLEGTHPDE